MANNQYNLAVNKFNLSNKSSKYSNFEKLITKTLINYSNILKTIKT